MWNRAAIEWCDYHKTETNCPLALKHKVCSGLTTIVLRLMGSLHAPKIDITKYDKSDNPKLTKHAKSDMRGLSAHAGELEIP